MKEKLFISLLACVLCATATYSQARVILPDSSQITTNPDSLDLLPRQIPEPNGQELDSRSPRQAAYLDHLINDHGAEADSLRRLAQMTIWKIDARTGSRLPAVSELYK